jgi:hypothetical protein
MKETRHPEPEVILTRKREEKAQLKAHLPFGMVTESQSILSPLFKVK